MIKRQNGVILRQGHCKERGRREVSPRGLVWGP